MLRIHTGAVLLISLVVACAIASHVAAHRGGLRQDALEDRLRVDGVGSGERLRKLSAELSQQQENGPIDVTQENVLSMWEHVMHSTVPSSREEEVAVSGMLEWFVLFYSPHCMACNEMIGNWDAFAMKHATRIHLGQVNCLEEVELCRAFEINAFPAIKLMMFGEVYTYPADAPRTLKAWREFLEGGWADEEPEYACFTMMRVLHDDMKLPCSFESLDGLPFVYFLIVPRGCGAIKWQCLTIDDVDRPSPVLRSFPSEQALVLSAEGRAWIEATEYYRKLLDPVRLFVMDNAWMKPICVGLVSVYFMLIVSLVTS